MSKYLLGAAVAAAAVAMSPAIAQTAQQAPNVQVQRAPMKAHTRAEVGNHIRAMFARLDTNRDGYVTKAEAQSAHGDRGNHAGMWQHRGGAAGAGGAANRGAGFDRLDANHDGAITRPEFDAGRAQRVARRDVNGDGRPDARGGRRGGGMGGFGGAMFDMADANRDGRVTLQEATAAAYRHFDMADVNRDGQISPDERMRLRQRMHGEHSRG